MKRFSPIHFFRRSDGAATVETVLWFPLLIAVFGLMLDVAMIFFGQAKVLRVVQDANREFSIGRYGDYATTQTAIETELALLGIVPTATVTFETAGVVTSSVLVPAAQLTVLGYFVAFDQVNINITADHMIENWET